MQRPELSIIMLSFNSALFIREAINSILNQTYADFELIIIDNGSDDESISIIQSFEDSRISLTKNETNKGIAYSRNQALKVARGNFISCFDSDDVAHPSKFEQQINFLCMHEDYGFVGSAVKLIDENGHVTARWKLSARPEMIPSIMLFHNYFVNSAVVFRRSILDDIHYHEGLEIGEDYLLWWMLLQKSKAINMPDYLTYYRQHNKSQMHRKAADRMAYDTKVYENILSQSGIIATQEDLKVHIELKDKVALHSYNQLKKNMDWLINIWVHFNRSNLHKASLRKVLLNRWMKVGLKARKKPLLFLSVIFNFTFYIKILLKTNS